MLIFCVALTLQKSEFVERDLQSKAIKMANWPE